MTDQTPRTEAGPLTPEEEGDLAVLLARKAGTYPNQPTDQTPQTEARHEDEYDALARQLHESIAEGQSIALTAKALRLLAQARTEALDVEVLAEAVDNVTHDDYTANRFRGSRVLAEELLREYRAILAREADR